MDKKLTYLVIAATAILHNGKRYEKGDKIELTEAEAENLSLYVQLDPSEIEKQAAEEQAEKERLTAEEAQKAAEEQAQKERLTAEETEKTAKKSAEKQAKTKAE